jgi:hypothetical protein
MNSLTKYTDLLMRFPTFELSYETVSHKKVSVQQNYIAVGISTGRKYFIWLTHRENSCEDAAYLLGLDKDKRVCSVEECSDATWFQKSETPEFGTIVYGTMCEFSPSDSRVFLAEDIYQYKDNKLSNLCFGDRIGFLRDFVANCHNAQVTNRPSSCAITWRVALPITWRVALPIMWHVAVGQELSPEIPPYLAKTMAYQAHHIQYRAISKVAPYINVTVPKRGTLGSTASNIAPVSSAEVAQKMTAAAILNPIPRFDYTKPAYRYSAVFNVSADPQLDLYHLYAYGGGSVAVYCGLAGIQSLRTSVFMNGIFRRIRENENLDLAEESEDEADFENTDLNKYVNLDAVVPIECVFNQKHKKWIPVKLANRNDKVIHIEKLAAGLGGAGAHYHKNR